MAAKPISPWIRLFLLLSVVTVAGLGLAAFDAKLGISVAGGAAATVAALMAVGRLRRSPTVKDAEVDVEAEVESASGDITEVGPPVVPEEARQTAEGVRSTADVGQDLPLEQRRRGYIELATAKYYEDNWVVEERR